MASNEKPLVPFCTYVVGSELGDVRYSKLPPSLCQEGPLNTLFDEIGDIQMKMFVPIVATNLVHLSRYEKDQNLGSHARYEIPSSSKSNLSHSNASTSGDAGAGEEDANQPTEEVLINDDYPAMQRICEKLESAEDKVGLIPTDIFAYHCVFLKHLDIDLRISYDVLFGMLH
jgi:hypothetical protein